MNFPAFEKEVRTHRGGGYHRLYGKLLRSEIHSWFQARAIVPPKSYVDFLSGIGPGVFFGGALTIFPLNSDVHRSVESDLSKLEKMSRDAIFSFGYDGTTESSYCLETTTGNDEVYWFSWEERIRRPCGGRFPGWIEAKPKELFSERSYAGYKDLVGIEKLTAVMEERAAFSVRLVSFDTQLRRPPDKPNDMFPRYNKLILEVVKARPVEIPVLTVIVRRLGSKVGAANVDYVTFSVSDVPVGVPILRECYVFDPFNAPFVDLQIEFNPVIDLDSKMRVRFKEISSLIGVAE